MERVIHIPCLSIAPTENKLEGKFDIGIVTSANALKYASNEVLSTLKSCKTVYSHGTKTIEALKKHGLECIQFDVRTAQEVFIKLRDMGDLDSSYLYVSSETPAFDMADALDSTGFSCTSHVVYRTTSKATTAAGFELVGDDIAAAAIDATYCFASPSAVKGFLEAFKPLKKRAEKSKIIAIGPKTREALAPHFKNITMAFENTVEALFEAALKD